MHAPYGKIAATKAYGQTLKVFDDGGLQVLCPIYFPLRKELGILNAAWTRQRETQRSTWPLDTAT